MTTATKPRASRTKKPAAPTAVAVNEDKGLVTLPTENLLTVFKTTEGIQPYIDQIRAVTVDLVFDMNVAKERDALRALAANIARSKTYMEEAGKGLTAEYKQLPAMIDATRRHMRDTLDALRDEVRKPLTEWEAVEAAKAQVIADKLTAIAATAQGLSSLTADQLRERLEAVRAVVIDASFGDKQLHAAAAKDASIDALEAVIPVRQQEEDDRAELQRLREDKERREREEEAQRAANALAQKKIDDANAQLELQQRQAKAREQELLEENERLRQAAAAPVSLGQRQAEPTRNYESRHQYETEPQAHYEQTDRNEPLEPADNAAEQEMHPVKDPATVNRGVLKAIVALGASPELAKTIVVAIVRGKIANVSIDY